MIGQTLHGRYKIVAEIGKGGMSTVYLAKDLNLDSYWAVKRVRNNTSAEFDSFKKEVELLASLSYSDIPRIVDRIELGEDYFVVMDFIDGTALSKIVNLEGPQKEANVIEWAVRLCDILAYLHTARDNPIVYRDLKPDNIMLTPSGGIKLIDFGIAQECAHGQRVQGQSLGTRGYAAPEQYRGGSNILDERTDIYSLGATMFFLATGISPGPPPNGVPPLRSAKQDLSDSLEYVIAKCTADSPDERYSNVQNLREDLLNIEHLTGIYRTRMRRKLIAFITSACLCVVFTVLGLVGHAGVKADNADRFQIAMQTASYNQRNEDYAGAAYYYAQAIAAMPGERSTYFLLFNVLLPAEGHEDPQQATTEAINEMRTSYLENNYSPMYHDPQLGLLVAKRCVEVGTPAYAQHALEYIGYAKESNEYESGVLSEVEIQSYEVVASFLAQDSASQDLSLFAASLEMLEEYADTAPMTTDERLYNYYVLVRMYSTYPASLDNAYAKAYEIGGKAHDLLQASVLSSEDHEIEFNSVIPMYELIASGQYNSADFVATDTEKENAYQNSLEWFGYLEDLNVPLTDTLLLKKAGAYKGIFDINNKPTMYGRISDEALRSLHKAVEIYEDLLHVDPTAYYPNLYRTQALLDEQLLYSREERDMSGVLAAYAQTQKLVNNDSTLTVTALMQFDALTRQLSNAGVEV